MTRGSSLPPVGRAAPAADPAPGKSVLDVACGTGIVARVAKAHLGSNAHVVGVDVSPNMLTVAAAVDPGVEWRQGTADALPVAEGESFDIVVCQQGLQFFSDRLAAVREIRRVLTPAGRLAAAVWTSLENNPFLLTLHRVAEREIGPITDRRHGFGDGAALQRLLEDAGLGTSAWRR